jgi:sulfur carrier protein ThiS adenylyltransferase
MNPFESAIAQYIGAERLQTIQKARIGIGGAGGLGSNCAVNLVRTGFKNLIIADFDHVEYSNLNRQFYFSHQVNCLKVEALQTNLLAINPDLNLTILKDKLTAENVRAAFQDCDVIVEAFDRVVYKKMIVEEFMHTAPLLVAASGLAGWGNSDAIAIHKIRPNFYLIGDLSTATDAATPPLSPRVSIAAAKQADIIVRYILHEL